MNKQLDAPDKITITYEHGYTGEVHSASLQSLDPTGDDIINWMAGVFESFKFGAVSVRLTEDNAIDFFDTLLGSQTRESQESTAEDKPKKVKKKTPKNKS